MTSSSSISSPTDVTIRSPKLLLSPKLESLKTECKSTAPWFSIRAKRPCENTKTSPIQHIYERKPTVIVPPNLKQLGEDRQFLESIYSCYSSTSNLPGGALSVSRFPMSREQMNRNSLLGLPAELDIKLLIKQDPQKAAEILEIQTVIPQDIPKEMKSGWWRITDPEQMQRINKSAHAR